MFDGLKLDLSKLYVDTTNDWPLLPRGIVEQLHICYSIVYYSNKSTSVNPLIRIPELLIRTLLSYWRKYKHIQNMNRHLRLIVN